MHPSTPVYSQCMPRTLASEPQDIYPNKTFRFIQMWVVDDSCWASLELARAWAVEISQDPNSVFQEQGLLFRGEPKDMLRVYRFSRSTIYELRKRLEVHSYDEKLREQALKKLTSEERTVLGLNE